MNSTSIIKNITGYFKSKGDKELLDAVREAEIDWECACSYFESVSEFRLIDYAIYNERAAALKYSYLISEIKKREIEEKNLAE